jgi:hypothetical protein
MEYLTCGYYPPVIPYIVKSGEIELMMQRLSGAIIQVGQGYESRIKGE